MYDLDHCLEFKKQSLAELLNKWPHLKPKNVEVGILIGLNCPSALQPRYVIHGNEDETYAVKSLLGCMAHKWFSESERIQW